MFQAMCKLSSYVSENFCPHEAYILTGEVRQSIDKWINKYQIVISALEHSKVGKEKGVSEDGVQFLNRVAIQNLTEKIKC